MKSNKLTDKRNLTFAAFAFLATAAIGGLSLGTPNIVHAEPTMKCISIGGDSLGLICTPSSQEHVSNSGFVCPPTNSGNADGCITIGAVNGNNKN